MIESICVTVTIIKTTALDDCLKKKKKKHSFTLDIKRDFIIVLQLPCCGLPSHYTAESLVHRSEQ